MLAAAAFVYVTAELVPVGALPAIAADLDVSEALVGTLLASYALVAAVATVPLVRATAHWPRRRTLLLTLVCLTVSQVISALAPTFAVLAGGRVLCALTHGLMWSVIAPIGTRLVPPSHAGRATTAVYAGTSLALVVGSPLTAAFSELWGWRTAVAVVAVAAALILLATRLLLPPMTLSEDQAHALRVRRRHHHNRRLVTLSVLTLIGVSGHFLSYTFIVVIIREVVGVSGPSLAWLLGAYGVAGLLSMALMARPLDRAPRAALMGGLAGIAVAFVVLAVLAWHASAGGVGTTLGRAVGIAAIVLWGAMATAVPPMLQAAAMRTSPEDPDGASGLYVAAFQVGIMAGSLAGGLLYETAGIGAMVASSALLVVIALIGVAVSRGLLIAPQEIASK